MCHLLLLILLQIFVYVGCSREVESLLAYNAAIEFHRNNDNVNALLKYKLAISHDMRFPEAHQNIGLLYETLGDVGLSIHHHEQSILYAATPEFKSSAIVNLVLVMLKSSLMVSNEENERFISMLMEAQLLNPSDENIEFTVGLIRDQMGQPEVAMQSFQKILSTNPNHSLALLNVGNYYFRRGNHEKSTEYFERTLLSIPEYDKNRKVLALNNLGQSYREQGRYNAALQSFLTAKSHQQEGEDKLAMTSSIQFYSINNVYTIQGLLCKWKDFELYEYLIEKFLVEANAEGSTVILNSDVNLKSLVDPYTMSLMRFPSLSFDRMVCKSAYTASPIYDHSASVLSEVRSNDDSFALPKLRVGYLSFDWRDHPMGRLTSHLVTSHNTTRVHSVSFSYGNDDGSSIRKLIKTKSPEFVDLSQVRNDFDAAAVVNSHQLDVLVDITAHTYNGRINIAALKPAPIVINYLGFPGTTGCSGFDYSMVDKTVVPPESAEGFSERLIYLPHSYQANNMPLSVPPCSQGRQECRSERSLITSGSYFGSALAGRERLLFKHHREEVQWICSFNANKKMEPLSFTSWTNILLRVPSSILILLDIPKDAREQLLLLCSYHGISHTRVLFIERQAWIDHLHRTAACDLVLDTFVYGAHTTSSDVLWMHVPIVTLRSFGSGRMPSRVAGSILGSLIPPEDVNSALHILIADSVKEYEDIAVRILTDVRLLAKLHDIIATNSLKSPTFDRYLMEEHSEKAYQAVHELRLMHRLKLPHIVVQGRQSKSGDSLMFEAAVEEIKIQMKGGEGCSGLNEIVSLCYCSATRNHISKLNQAAAVSRRLLRSYPGKLKGEFGMGMFSGNILVPLRQIQVPSPSKEAIVELVKLLYPLRFEPEYHDHLMFLNHYLKRGVITDVQSTLLAVLDAQAALSRNCEEDMTLFWAVLNSVLHECKQCDAMGLLGHDGHPALVKATQLIPKSLLPSRVYWSRLEPHDHDHGHVNVILSHILHNHALCAMDAWSASDSAPLNKFIGLTLSALALDFQWDALHKFGLTLMDSAQGDSASDAIEYGYQVASLAFVNIHREMFIPAPSNVDPRHTGAVTVALYCYEYGQSWWPGWGPTSIAAGKGLGGSEEAVYQTAIELSRLGYHVTIYSEIPKQDIGVITHEQEGGGHVKWLHYKNLDLDRPCDVFIAWRYSMSLSLGKIMAKRSYLWLHDLVPGTVLPLSVFTDHAGVLVQSSFHKQHILQEVAKFSQTEQFDPTQLIANKIIIAHNGITLPSEDFAQQPLRNDNSVFIYGSAPNRGLGLLLHAWRQIKQAIPEATLEVYYGFTDAVMKHMKSTMGEEPFNRWYDHVMTLLQQDGVKYFGPVDPDTLLQAYQRAGFWLYPTTFQETGCITGIKAMASGAIPITSRLQESVLIELTDKFDLGPSVPLNLSVAWNPDKLDSWLNKEFIQAVIRAQSFSKEQLDGHRTVMRYEVTQEYTWRNTALKLSALFKRDLL